MDTSRDGQLTPKGNLLSGAATIKANAPHKNCPAPFPEQGRGDLSRRETMQTFKIVKAASEYNIEKATVLVIFTAIMTAIHLT